MRISAGMALMKPTSFLFEETLTPQCHWGNQPGGRRALREENMLSEGAERFRDPPLRKIQYTSQYMLKNEMHLDIFYMATIMYNTIQPGHNVIRWKTRVTLCRVISYFCIRWVSSLPRPFRRLAASAESTTPKEELAMSTDNKWWSHFYFSK